MSNQNAAVLEAPVEVEEPEVKKSPRAKDPDRKPKRLPPYAVVVLNDDLHTFQYVIDTFKKVFRYSTPRCFLYATQIHVRGRCIVWSGSKEVAELKRDQIRSAGPDFYSPKKVDFPLGVEIEPLPQ